MSATTLLANDTMKLSPQGIASLLGSLWCHSTTASLVRVDLQQLLARQKRLAFCGRSLQGSSAAPFSSDAAV